MCNEKHSKNMERWPARPYGSRGAGSWVVLHHRAVAAACVCLTVDASAAAAYCTPEARPRLGHQMVFLHSNCPNLTGFTKVFKHVFLQFVIVDYHFLTENYFCDHVYYHSFLQCRRRLRLQIRKERIIFRRCPSLNSGALAVPRQPKNSGAATEFYSNH